MKKIILITGGSDGLGKGLAQRLAKNHQVIILGRNLIKTQEAAIQLGIDYLVADVSDYSKLELAMAEFLAKYEKIDCLVNNAGLWIQGKLEENDSKTIKSVIEVNTLGTIYSTKAVLPIMKRQNFGRIINVISQSGLYPKADRTVYHASKWAITGFTKSLALELENTKISVCGFYPGGIKTDLFQKQGNQKDTSDFMDISVAVDSLEFMINAPENISITELGIKT